MAWGWGNVGELSGRQRQAGVSYAERKRGTAGWGGLGRGTGQWSVGTVEANNKQYDSMSCLRSEVGD